jgi:saccharopine dehydrogenase (NAD+, L-lysine-forming)
MASRRMKPIIGIRREDKNVWERRVPLTPDHVRDLIEDFDVGVVVQPSEIRVYTAEEYESVGATVREDMTDCRAVFAVKELPIDFIQPEKTYVFFAHVIKGQPYNMAMLRRLLDYGCTVIDYELVTDDKGRRLIFFGRHAGLAGMVETLWAFGRRLEWEGVANPFSGIKRAWEYDGLDEIRTAVEAVGAKIKTERLPEGLRPLVFGFAGYGNVSQGAQEVLDYLPVTSVAPEDLEELMKRADYPGKTVYKVVFEERHMVRPAAPGAEFELQDYYDRPEKYGPNFEEYLPYVNVLVNCVYWDARYPRLITKEYLKENFPGKTRLKVVGDISCDVEGAVEATVKTTTPGEPVFVYDPKTGEAADGVDGDGLVILAVDTLPAEIPREASEHFSAMLEPYVPAIARVDYDVPFGELALPPPIKRAVLAHRGALTEKFEYIMSLLEKIEEHEEETRRKTE